MAQSKIYIRCTQANMYAFNQCSPCSEFIPKCDLMNIHVIHASLSSMLWLHDFMKLLSIHYYFEFDGAASHTLCAWYFSPNHFQNSKASIILALCSLLNCVYNHYCLFACSTFTCYSQFISQCTGFYNEKETKTSTTAEISTFLWILREKRAEL